MTRNECLEILELPFDASRDDIVKAYRQLAQVWHPDRFPNNADLQQKANAKLAKINEAYQALRDEKFSKEPKATKKPKVDEWFYAIDGKKNGPIKTSELVRLATSGILKPDDLVWKEGFPEWLPARQIKGLKDVFPRPKPIVETIDISTGPVPSFRQSKRLKFPAYITGLMALMILTVLSLVIWLGYDPRSTKLLAERQPAQANPKNIMGADQPPIDSSEHDQLDKGRDPKRKMPRNAKAGKTDAIASETSLSTEQLMPMQDHQKLRERELLMEMLILVESSESSKQSPQNAKSKKISDKPSRDVPASVPREFREYFEREIDFRNTALKLLEKEKRRIQTMIDGAPPSSESTLRVTLTTKLDELNKKITEIMQLQVATAFMPENPNVGDIGSFGYLERLSALDEQTVLARWSVLKLFSRGSGRSYNIGIVRIDSTRVTNHNEIDSSGLFRIIEPDQITRNLINNGVERLQADSTFTVAEPVMKAEIEKYRAQYEVEKLSDNSDRSTTVPPEDKTNVAQEKPIWRKFRHPKGMAEIDMPGEAEFDSYDDFLPPEPGVFRMSLPLPGINLDHIDQPTKFTAVVADIRYSLQVNKLDSLTVTRLKKYPREFANEFKINGDWQRDTIKWFSHIGIASDRNLRLGKARGREFRLELLEETVIVRWYMTPTHECVASIVLPKNRDTTSERERFLNSLTIDGIGDLNARHNERTDDDIDRLNATDNEAIGKSDVTESNEMIPRNIREYFERVEQNRSIQIKFLDKRIKALQVQAKNVSAHSHDNIQKELSQAKKARDDVEAGRTIIAPLPSPLLVGDIGWQEVLYNVAIVDKNTITAGLYGILQKGSGPSNSRLNGNTLADDAEAKQRIIIMNVDLATMPNSIKLANGKDWTANALLRVISKKPTAEVLGRFPKEKQLGVSNYVVVEVLPDSSEIEKYREAFNLSKTVIVQEPKIAVAADVVASDHEVITSKATGMKFVLVPEGQFEMGSRLTKNELATRLGKFDVTEESFSIEHPPHIVKISQSFYLGQYEVTVGEFGQFVSDEKYKTEAEADGWGWGWDNRINSTERNLKYNWKNPGFSQTENHPVLNVSWNDAQAFCRWLSLKDGVTYRLPTEAEWEYSCRAGTNTLWSNGDDPEDVVTIGNVADGTARAKIPSLKSVEAEDGFVFTAPVGKFKANRFGLYDMHGNAWEWCQDIYDKTSYGRRTGIEVDPEQRSGSTFRVLRGGCWGEVSQSRSSARSGSLPNDRGNAFGFRVLRAR